MIQQKTSFCQSTGTNHSRDVHCVAFLLGKKTQREFIQLQQNKKCKKRQYSLQTSISSSKDVDNEIKLIQVFHQFHWNHLFNQPLQLNFQFPKLWKQPVSPWLLPSAWCWPDSLRCCHWCSRCWPSTHPLPRWGEALPSRPLAPPWPADPSSWWPSLYAWSAPLVAMHTNTLTCKKIDRNFNKFQPTMELFLNVYMVTVAEVQEKGKIQVLETQGDVSVIKPSSKLRIWRNFSLQFSLAKDQRLGV